MKILIAEDESDLRMLLHDQISGAGHEVIEAENGMQALQLFQSEVPDMAVLDVMMPVMDGFSLLAQIRETSDKASMKDKALKQQERRNLKKVLPSILFL